MDWFSALSADAIVSSFRTRQSLFDLLDSLSALHQQCEVYVPACRRGVSLAGAIVWPLLQCLFEPGDLLLLPIQFLP
jgi:hypothetical protein